jgi:formate hydrogenlyase transcriptional activator
LSLPKGRRLNELQHDHIRGVLESTRWRVRGQGGAAEVLGLKPTTLEARMKKMGLRRRA